MINPHEEAQLGSTICQHGGEPFTCPVCNAAPSPPTEAAVLEAQLEVAKGALRYYANYMSGDNPEFMKSGWQKYPDPKRARAALAKLEGE